MSQAHPTCESEWETVRNLRCYDNLPKKDDSQITKQVDKFIRTVRETSETTCMYEGIYVHKYICAYVYMTLCICVYVYIIREAYTNDGVVNCNTI